VEENRVRIRRKVETIISLGGDLAFRGPLFHNINTSDESDVCVNERALKFRVSAGDKKLEEHLQSAHSNTTYVS
jgi:hypothetical protein